MVLFDSETRYIRPTSTCKGGASCLGSVGVFFAARLLLSMAMRYVPLPIPRVCLPNTLHSQKISLRCSVVQGSWLRDDCSLARETRSDHQRFITSHDAPCYFSPPACLCTADGAGTPSRAHQAAPTTAISQLLRRARDEAERGRHGDLEEEAKKGHRDLAIQV